MIDASMIQQVKHFLLVNSNAKQTIAKNTFWLFSGQIISRLLRVVIVIYGARLLGVENWGAFSYALGFGTFFTTFIDFGINAVITRESVKDLTKQEKYFATSFFIKIILSVSVSVLLLIFSPWLIELLAQEADVVKILPLMPFIIGIVIFDGLRDFAATLSRAWEKMEVESFIQVSTNVIIVLASFIALYFSQSAQSLAIGYAIGTGIGMAIAFYPFRHYLVSLRKKISFDLIKPIIGASWPFGMLGIMGIVMLNTDTIVLGWFRGLETVGYYSAAQKIAQFIQSLPGLIAIAFFPSLAKSASNIPYFKTLVERASRVLIIIAIPITLVGICYPDVIVNVLYGSTYYEASRTFQLLNLTYIFSFLVAIFSNAVFALGKEKKLFLFVLLGIGGNFLLDILFIPTFGASGAALSTVINFGLITLYLFWLLKKEVHIKLLTYPYKIFAAAGSMLGIILVSILLGIHAYIGAPLGIAIYLIILWKSKETALLELVEGAQSFITKKLG